MPSGGEGRRYLDRRGARRGAQGGHAVLVLDCADVAVPRCVGTTGRDRLARARHTALVGRDAVRMALVGRDLVDERARAAERRHARERATAVVGEWPESGRATVLRVAGGVQVARVVVGEVVAL